MSEKFDLYCNPAPLPELPLGMFRRYPGRGSAGYTAGECDFREVADPEVLFFEGKYYMYCSCRQVYVSDDLIHWQYCPIQIDYPLGYAPAVTRCGKNIYLTSSREFNDPLAGRIFQAEHPLGPFRTVGEVRDKAGQLIKEFLDPALFADDDGRLYLYWGYAPVGGGIFGMEVDPEQPNCGISDIVKLFDLDGDNQWERFGEHGEVLDFGWTEGASMYKHNGIYYLQYAACGTRFPNYSIGVYMLESPLQKPQKKAVKLCGSRHGIVCGTGHGGMFTGPGGTVWQAYSVLVHRKHFFERRAGIDPVTFDENGVPHVAVSNEPRQVAGGKAELVNAAAWKNCRVSSYCFNSQAMFAVDEMPHTAWVPELSDDEPFIEVDLERGFAVEAVRIIWSEENLDIAAGRVPQPVKYRVDFFDENKSPLDFQLDLSDNCDDLVVDFREFAPLMCRYVRLTILRGSSNMHYGVSDLAVFVRPRRIYS